MKLTLIDGRHIYIRVAHVSAFATTTDGGGIIYFGTHTVVVQQDKLFESFQAEFERSESDLQKAKQDVKAIQDNILARFAKK